MFLFEKKIVVATNLQNDRESGAVVKFVAYIFRHSSPFFSKYSISSQGSFLEYTIEEINQLVYINVTSKRRWTPSPSSFSTNTQLDDSILPASWHVCPHPLKQHFLAPVQLESTWHSSKHIALEFLSGTGHIPSFSSVNKIIKITTFILHTIANLLQNKKKKWNVFCTPSEHEVVVHWKQMNQARFRSVSNSVHGVSNGNQETIILKLHICIHTSIPIKTNWIQVKLLHKTSRV